MELSKIGLQWKHSGEILTKGRWSDWTGPNFLIEDIGVNGNWLVKTKGNILIVIGAMFCLESSGLSDPGTRRLC